MALQKLIIVFILMNIITDARTVMKCTNMYLLFILLAMTVHLGQQRYSSYNIVILSIYYSYIKLNRLILLVHDS